YSAVFVCSFPPLLCPFFCFTDTAPTAIYTPSLHDALPILVLVKGLRILGFQFRDIDPGEFARNEQELTGLLTSGRVSPHIGAVFPLEQARAALQEVAHGRAVGKILLDLT